ncbi:transposase domain-containing protein [Vibrio sp. 10N.286.52.E2]|uniref:transposase domain-containing protein n=1 Tax=Vibrio sp. 10N.286.52.E2 TaxID=3229714 RepID=UPI00354E2920
MLTCRLHGINPYTYLVDVLRYIQPLTWLICIRPMNPRGDLSVFEVPRQECIDIGLCFC